MAPILSNDQILPGIHLIWVSAPEIAASAQPGQFVMVRCGEGFDPLLRRPLSIHRVTPGGEVAFLFAVLGRGTKWLSRSLRGGRLDIVAPLGRGFSLPSSPQSLLLIAGGRGIAPLVFLAERALSQGHLVALLLGASSRAQLYPQSLLPPGIQLSITTEDGSEGSKGKVTDLVSALACSVDQVFVCGPLPLYQVLATQSLLRGKVVQVSLEARMGCGLGVCYGCTLRTKKGLKQVCQDGPVFELEEIYWESSCPTTLQQPLAT